MVEKVFRFSIKADNEIHLFGGRNRVAIQKFAKGFKRKGSVRNLKGESEIEIFLVAEDREDVLKFYADMVNETRISGSLTTIIEATWIEPKRFVDFHIVREDELTEMVWALQGAGDIFIQTYKAIVDRDNKKAKAVLTGLSAEVNYNIQLIEKSREGKLHPKYIRTLCIERRIIEPIDSDGDFVNLMQDTYYLIQDLQELARSQAGIDAGNGKRKNLEERLKELKGSIEKKLKVL